MRCVAASDRIRCRLCNVRGSASTIAPWASRCARAKARSSPWTSRTSMKRIEAPVSVQRLPVLLSCSGPMGSLDCRSRQPWKAEARSRLRSRNHLPPNPSAYAMEIPVRFPPGRARLAAGPVPKGSPIIAATIGTVVVASLAATAPGVP